MAPCASEVTEKEVVMGSETLAAFSEVADAILRFCPALLIAGEAEAAADEGASVGKAVLGGIMELEVVSEGVTCLGNTAVFSVLLSLVDVDPNTMGISVVSGSKTIEEADPKSGEGDASSVCLESRDSVNEA